MSASASDEAVSEVVGAPQQPFSIIPEYLRLAGAGEKILGFCADGYYWRDLGTAVSLQQAVEDIAHGRIE